MTDIELMNIQVEVLFKHNHLGRLTEINEPSKLQAPLFFLGRTKLGNIIRFNNELDHSMICKMNQYLTESDSKVDLATITTILKKEAPINNFWMGPAYVFPDNIKKPSSAIKITDGNKTFLQTFFPHLVNKLEWIQPCFVILKDGDAVSVCCSARRSSLAAEASLETVVTYRGRGFGLETATAWAMEIQKEKRIPLYSTAWDNFSSQSVAKKLNLHQYGIDLHIS
jgi:hypothetical protein